MRVRPTLVSATVLALAGLGGPVAATQSSAAPASPAVRACVGADGAIGARVKRGSKAQEPTNDNTAAGPVPDAAYLGDGAVTVDTVVHVMQPTAPSRATQRRFERAVGAQIDVLNASYAGTTAGDAAATPFRFRLSRIDYVVDADWYAPAGGSQTTEEMKKALHEGGPSTLNVYTVDFGASGLLGYATFPSTYNKAKAAADGVVIEEQSLPGGDFGSDYSLGDTLVHEVGHWLGLYHTFQGACSASNDFVADTPREAVPQFECSTAADTCPQPGLDPVHNFMDYTYDSCLDMFTRGQAERMSDAWVAYRAVG